MITIIIVFWSLPLISTYELLLILLIGGCTFDTMTGDRLVAIVNATYKETSKYLLQVLNTKYNFAEHLKVSKTLVLTHETSLD